MKKKVILLSAVILSGLFFYNFTTLNSETSSTKAEKNALVVPDNVQQILENSCIGCHNAESRSEKAKAKLSFESLDTLTVSKLIGKLSDISDEVSENKMPPAKFLEFKPEAALTSEQKDALIVWAKSAADSLIRKK